VSGLAGATFIGELRLDGRVRPVRGVLAMVLAVDRELAELGVDTVVIPCKGKPGPFLTNVCA
jgi:predicted ATPase with chaperone activity